MKFFFKKRCTATAGYGANGRQRRPFVPYPVHQKNERQGAEARRAARYLRHRAPYLGAPRYLVAALRQHACVALPACTHYKYIHMLILHYIER